MMITELRPTSLPVPAVVGIAMNGARPVQSASKSNCASVFSGRLTRRRTALPTSIALPPPKAITASQPFSRKALKRAFHIILERIWLHIREDRFCQSIQRRDEQSEGLRPRQTCIGDNQRAITREPLKPRVQLAPHANSKQGRSGKRERRMHGDVPTERTIQRSRKSGSFLQKRSRLSPSLAPRFGHFRDRSGRRLDELSEFWL